jgi:hypothetical protein
MIIWTLFVLSLVDIFCLIASVYYAVNSEFKEAYILIAIHVVTHVVVKLLKIDFNKEAEDYKNKYDIRQEGE